MIEVLNERAPGFARLEAPQMIAALPRTPLGKIDGAALRDEFATR